MSTNQLRAKLPHASASFLRLNKMAGGEPIDPHTHDPHDVTGSKHVWKPAAMITDRFSAHGLPAAICEYRFHKTRKWRFDYAWPDFKVALEVEGGVWTGGRHTRGAGFLKDIEKYNAAGVAGWTVLRCTPDTINSAETVKMLREVLP